MENATGLNKWDLFLELRKRYLLICKDLDGNKDEYDDIKELSKVNEINIHYVEMEPHIFDDPIITEAIKRHYDLIID